MARGLHHRQHVDPRASRGRGPRRTRAARAVERARTAHDGDGRRHCALARHRSRPRTRNARRVFRVVGRRRHRGDRSHRLHRPRRTGARPAPHAQRRGHPDPLGAHGRRDAADRRPGLAAHACNAPVPRRHLHRGRRRALPAVAGVAIIPRRHPLSRLETRKAVIGYGGPPVVHGVDIDIPDGRITAIVGPNGCGKSTLLRALIRLLAPSEGTILLDGEDIHRRPTREVARRVGLLPQSPIAPTGITVKELVARGRIPHQKMLRPWSSADEAAVFSALHSTNLTDIQDSVVDELSGGQRQRAWIAMTLAQDTPLMLLDEPTTFLDISHQYEVLDLLHRLNERQSRTIVMVVHDLHQAARYAHHVIAMRDGIVAASGAPKEVFTEALVRDVFGFDARVLPDPVTGTPIVIPAHGPGGAR
ncbi:MAG: ABC transporter ATP-binding protein [Demequinaceae bacterium]|nr:ABC transporter ATP-binding protein [Demequinaceae bacterium]